jgi:type IV secretory pathway TrbL component
MKFAKTAVAFAIGTLFSAAAFAQKTGSDSSSTPRPSVSLASCNSNNDLQTLVA